MPRKEYCDEEGKKIDGRQFNKGHVGKAGRKPAPHKSELMQALEKGDKDIIPIIIKEAAKGNHAFIKIWASYRFGNPTAIEKDTGGGIGSIDHSELINKLKYDFEDNNDDDDDDDENFFDED